MFASLEHQLWALANSRTWLKSALPPQSNLGNAETDGLSDDLRFVGQEYSLLVLLFYIPNGLCDLPLNMLTKRFSGKVMLPILMTGWGAMSMVQAACRNFAEILVVRLVLA